jgi:hypothetical protein
MGGLWRVLPFAWVTCLKTIRDRYSGPIEMVWYVPGMDAIARPPSSKKLARAGITTFYGQVLSDANGNTRRQQAHTLS